ncbi:MAG: crossover junction endodeoxyribonuclease RuvC [Candidatus Omnitrophica bacterium]|nr:crossover junction endodeoxyribonuclease RuvC [Candidatus Omnitrophota bacterium]
MKIIGVDPGLKATGYGVIEVDQSGRIRPLEAGSIEPKSRELFENKLFKIRKNLDDIVVRQAPDALVLEKLYSHYKHPVTAAIMGHVRGVICLLCAERGIPLIEESPKRVRKAVVGNGNASKEQTRRVIASFLKIDPAKLTLDASDALALAMAHAQMRRFVG